MPTRVERRRRLIGREADAAAVRALILDEGAPLVTLTGPGGMGKTTLAQFAAASLSDAFAGYTHFVDLTPVADPGHIADRIAQSLELADADLLAPLDRVAEYYGERRALLILDNFEHLIDGATVIVDLLRVCPGLQLLITSREALRLRDERVYPLPPLGLPATAQAGDLQALGQVPAVDLFVRRAQAMKPDFGLTPENATVIAAIVARLDGLPLAIELAAARVRLLTPAALLAQLEASPLKMLGGGARDLPARQQTIRDTIAWSFDLLEPAEARLFRRLGVFAGGFTLAAAEAVTAEAFDELAIDAGTRIGSLLDKSLINRIAGDDLTEPRFGLLVTLQAYALEQLRAVDEEPRAREAHLAYYLAFAEAAVPNYRGSEHYVWLMHTAAEEDNLRAALAWAVEGAAADPVRAGWAIQLAGALGDYWQHYNRVVEGERWLQQILPFIPARVLDQETAAPEDRLQLSREARALSAAGTIAWRLGDFPRAQTLHERAMRAYAAAGDRAQETDSRHNLAVQLNEQGATTQAIELYEQAIAFYEQTNNQVGLARVLIGVAIVHGRRGDEDKGLQINDIVLQIGRKTGNSLLLAMALGNQAQAYLRRGDLDRADELLTEAIRVNREVGLVSNTIDQELALGRLREAQGDFRVALQTARRAIELADTESERRFVADGLEQAAFASHYLGKTAQGARLLGAAAALRARMGAIDTRDQPQYYRERKPLLLAALGDDRFAAEWQIGATLSRAAAVALALAEFAPAGGPQQLGQPRMVAATRPADPLAELTPREREVALLMARGLTNDQIARELFVTVKTVEKHAGNALGKLQLRNRAELAAWAAARGLLDPP